jgi:S1-C subfamily serine protease
MKIISYRTTMPFDNKGTDGGTYMSPPTQKSIMPFNNVPTIQDLLDGNRKIGDVYPHAGGSWSPGEDSEKSYKDEGDDYKRAERDQDLLKNMFKPREKTVQSWEVNLPGGKRKFISFELARKYTREKGLPFTYVRRVAQNLMPEQTEEDQRLNIITDSMDKTFMVQSVAPNSATIETGAAFCVFSNYFITCAHVIKSYNKNLEIGKDYFSKSIISLTHNSKKFHAQLIDVDPKLDIALLKSNIGVDPMVIDTNITIGEEIIAIGSPHGYENNVSTGTIGSLDRKVYGYNGAPDYMFVDLSVFPGNSGGPVIRSSNGNIVGMVTLIISSSGGYGLNAALPATHINNFCKKNIENFK